MFGGIFSTPLHQAQEGCKLAAFKYSVTNYMGSHNGMLELFVTSDASLGGPLIAGELLLDVLVSSLVVA